MSDRPYVPWMTRNDEELLEFMAEHDAALSPVTAIGHSDLDVDGDPVSVLFRRLPLLYAAGLVEEAAHGEYTLATKGRSYLAGDLDPTELETPADAT